jgi:proteasome lid subunit RPN8/RPN11
MFRSKNPKVNISIPRKALEAIFDECDRFDVDETGGKIVGTYQKKGREYCIDVLGVIDAGPNAKRSPTSLFQDGEYQERVFRSVEKEHPDLEHLGSWHSHHVNGLSTLSSGDKITYHNIVNHDKHNTDFFYALLVVRKTINGNQRYEVKHYLVFRNDDVVYEIPGSQIHLLEQSRCSPRSTEGIFGSSTSSHETEVALDANVERVRDQEFFVEFFPGLKPGFSKTLGALYWKGQLALVDGSHAEVLVMESKNNGKPFYSIALTGRNLPLSRVLESYKDRSFNSARAAVFHLERDVNRELYRGRKE